MESFSSNRSHRQRHSSSPSSAMKFSSKPSILSPSRAADPPICLSTSRSRRLRTSRSIKNGLASPMFPNAGGRKKGGGGSFEIPEPSSPKVTCIGQVRGKKKKEKKVQTLTRRRSAEVSFRRSEHGNHGQLQRQSSVNSQYQLHQEFSSHRNQRWVHLPLTICETLRGFGSDFSCLFPCKASCFSETQKVEEKVESERNDDGQSPCGAMFRRWLVAMQDDGEGEKAEGDAAIEEEEEEGEWPTRTARRHVFDEIEIEDDLFQVKDHDGNAEGGKGGVSICVPPKNALLLMRCRSDPLKMEALASRCWKPQLPKQEEEEEEEDDMEEERPNGEGNNNKDAVEAVTVEVVELKDEEEVEMVAEEMLEQVCEEERDSVSADINEEEEEIKNQPEAEESPQQKQVQDNKEDEAMELPNYEAVEDGGQEEAEKERLVEEDEDEFGFAMLFEVLPDEDSEEDDDDDDDDPTEDNNQEEESRVSYSNASFSLQSDQEMSEAEEEEEELAEEAALESENSVELVTSVEKETQDKTLEPEEGRVKRESNAAVVEEKTEKIEISSRLPDSLLLMMYEPKLSMEVFKETWVCSRDFIRWNSLPVQLKPTEEATQDKSGYLLDPISVKKSCSQNVLQPSRSSCCLPASMASVIERKLVSSVAFEPFVLTRCKSAPLRTPAKKVAPDACFWKNRTLEPHRRATFGIGAAEIGF